jgi:hypothetical protein
MRLLREAQRASEPAEAEFREPARAVLRRLPQLSEDRDFIAARGGELVPGAPASWIGRQTKSGARTGALMRAKSGCASMCTPLFDIQYLGDQHAFATVVTSGGIMDTHSDGIDRAASPGAIYAGKRYCKVD